MVRPLARRRVGGTTAHWPRHLGGARAACRCMLGVRLRATAAPARARACTCTSCVRARAACARRCPSGGPQSKGCARGVMLGASRTRLTLRRAAVPVTHILCALQPRRGHDESATNHALHIPNNNNPRPHCSARAANHVGTVHETGAQDSMRIRRACTTSAAPSACVRVCAGDDRQFDNKAQFDLMHR